MYGAREHVGLVCPFAGCVPACKFWTLIDINEIQKVVSREMPVDDGAIITIGTIHGGEVTLPPSFIQF
jgi:hypothetical protein